MNRQHYSVSLGLRKNQTRPKAPQGATLDELHYLLQDMHQRIVRIETRQAKQLLEQGLSLQKDQS